MSKAIILTAAIMLLPGCSTIGGPHSWFGKTTATIEGGTGRPGWGSFFADWEMRAHLLSRMSELEPDLYANVSLYVLDKRVLAVGVLQSQEQKMRLESFLHLTAPHANIEDRTIFAQSYGVSVRLHDSWLEKKIEMKLLFSEISSHNFDVIIFNGHAFVMGVALSEEEREKVLGIVRDTDSVDGWTDFIRVASSKDEQFKVLQNQVGEDLRASHDQQRRIRGMKGKTDMPDTIPEAVRSPVEVVKMPDDDE
ncbi:MAG: BON domain-containing protein [Alphaproteobacteria bacterium]|nr:BON domain-containing protein [Alphaproteobacteria bacterium]